MSVTTAALSLSVIRLVVMCPMRFVIITCLPIDKGLLGLRETVLVAVLFTISTDDRVSCWGIAPVTSIDDSVAFWVVADTAIAGTLSCS